MERKNTEYLSLLSVLSAMAVVIMHTNGCYWHFSTERYWVTANILNSIACFAVPIFFMISGATLMDYRQRYSTREFFKKRVQKTVVPYIFWSLVSLLCNVVLLRYYGFDKLTPGFILNGLFTNNINSVYWFFTPLFAMYLSMPLFSAVPKEMRRSVFSYLAVAGFLLNSVIPLAIKLFDLPFGFTLSLSVAGSSLLFMLIGYLLKEEELTPRMRWLIYAVSAAGLLLYMVGTHIYSFREGKVSDMFKGTIGAPGVCYAVGIFVFFRQHGNRLMAGFVGKVVRFLKPYVFPLYLLHMPLLQWIQKLGLFSIRSIWWRVFGVCILLPVCMLITWIIRKIPVLRRTLPD